ncbi:Ig-like domain repeat protein, partial [bacterium]
AVEARFVEDDSYLASQRLGSVAQPAPGAAQLEMSTPTPVKVGETAHLSAKLTVNGTPLTGHDVSFKIAGVEVGTATTDATGVASLDRKIDEGPAGTWSVEATFSGGGGYGATSDADALSVLRAPSAVVVPSLDARVGVPVTLRATLSRTTDAKALAGKSVSFLVDGLAVGSAMTGADGVAELAFTTYFMTVGAHPVVARFTEDDSYLASEGSSSLTLAAAKQALEMWVGPRTVYVGENVVYRATLKLTGTSQFVLGKTIAFYLDGRLIGTGITGGTQGFAEVSEVLPEDTLSGSHTIRAEFVEDADYLGVTGTATLTAKKAPTYVWVGNRNAVPGQIVQFRSNVKNEFTKALLLGKTLNSKVGTWLVWSAITAGTSGYAEANLQLPEGMPAGDYVITSTFDGDQSYEPSTSNGTLTVSRAAVSLWIGNRSGRAGQSVQYRATIQNSTSKTYLSGKVLRVKMGTTVIGTATSGADGYITINSVIPSNTPVGTQTLTVEFDGDAAYKPGTASGTLTVNP